MVYWVRQVRYSRGDNAVWAILPGYVHRVGSRTSRAMMSMEAAMFIYGCMGYDTVTSIGKCIVYGTGNDLHVLKPCDTHLAFGELYIVVDDVGDRIELEVL